MASLTMCFSSCKRIDAAHEGMKVNLYGNKKGIDSIPMVSGMVWYNPLMYKIYQYPIYVQTVDFPMFTINANGGMEFNIDPTVSLRIIEGHSPQVFKKYRKKRIEDVINTTLYNIIKDAFRVELNKFTTDELISQREVFETAIENRISQILLKEGFYLEHMTSGLNYPKDLNESIIAKNKAVQDAITAENEVKKIEAEAKKKIALAEGEAQAMRIKADAEAYYNKTISSSLSTLIIQEDFIEKWDGRLPTYGEVPTLMKNITQ
ncbi:MAG: hypothetical protein IKT40_01285 [Bacilli bacterium]|nr:hypothetical protein [Bacilli bacterium]